MGSRRWAVAVLCFGLLGALAAMTAHEAAAASDALADAKRKAATQLMKDGKIADAAALMKEVTTADDTSPADHLFLAHAYEKLNQPASATHEFKRVLELIPAAPTKAEDKAARAEADRKIKQVDPLGGKLDAATDEYLHKLDGLEKDAIALHSMASMERIFRLRGHVWRAEHREDRASFEVYSSANGAQEGAFMVVAGQAYHVRAAGTYVIKGGIACTAAGVPGPLVAGAHHGQLLGHLNGRYYLLGEDVTFTPEYSGPITFEAHEPTNERSKNTGSIQIIIEPK